MQVFGLMMVRNEADILRVNLLYHLALGIDQFLIVDNGSTDDTPEILEELSRNTGRVHWARDDGPYRQAEITTGLAHKARQRGADWVLPIDADEFWHVLGGDLRGVLQETKAGALKVQVVNFVQRREQLQATPDALLHMTRRVAIPFGPGYRVQELIESRRRSGMETVSQPKWISRPGPEIDIAMGNHSVRGAYGPNQPTDRVVCLHASLRARSVLETRMVDHGSRAEDLLDEGLWWHVRRWRREWEAGGLDAEWAANSYSDDCLDVYGVKHPVVYDPRLRDLTAPWIQPDELDRQQDRSGHLIPRLEDGAAWIKVPEQKLSATAGVHDQWQWERSALLRTIHDQLSSHNAQMELVLEDLRAPEAELQEKLGEANRVIADLQAELHEKVGEANRVIAELRAEQQTKLNEREQSIHDLRAELHEKVGEANSVIAEQQAELHEKVGEANVIIRDLQAQLAAARNASAEPTPVEDIPSEHAAELAEETLAEHDRAIRTLEAEVSALQRSRAWRVVGTYYGLRELLRAVPVRLRRAGRGR